MNPYSALLRPLVTEKSTNLREQGSYVFEVRREATKLDVRRAIEELFDVKVEDVNTMLTRGRLRRTPYGKVPSKTYKKAIVKLRDGDQIKLFEE
ncbi:MAG: 50S ribosomal protein L23 [Oligoflexales bacterium]